MNIRGLIGAIVLLFGCSTLGMAAQTASACLVKPGPEGSTALDFRNDCGHPITIVKVARSGGAEKCFRAEMLEGKTWHLTPKDKACSILVAQNAAGNPCDCPAGTAVDLANAPFATGNRTMSKRELAEERQVVENACTSSQFLSTYVNCNCLVEKVESERVEATQKVWEYFAEKNYEHCPNDKRTISDYVFTMCDNTNRVLRKDHAEYCRCAGDRTADSYLAQPQFKLAYIEMLQRNAYVSCGIGDQSKNLH